MSIRPPLHHFTVAQYEKMVAVDILNEDDRVELIRGEIVAKMTIGIRHAASVRRLTNVLSDRARGRGIVDVQNPAQLADSMPEPDVMLLVPRDDFYASSRPQPVDILLLIEVADSSIENDRKVKSPLYAENGIAEYWIVNLEDNCVEVYRQPRPDGIYADIRTLRTGDTADIEALPGISIAVAEIL